MHIYIFFYKSRVFCWFVCIWLLFILYLILHRCYFNNQEKETIELLENENENPTQAVSVWKAESFRGDGWSWLQNSMNVLHAMNWILKNG